MKLWKKILITLLILLGISQIPGIYHLYQTYSQNSAIAASAASRRKQPDTGYKEFKGVIHLHTRIGGHSYGTFQEVVKASKKRNLDFVVMTEHIAPDKDTFGKSFDGKKEGVLFVNGNELSVKENRFLVIESFKDILKAAKKEPREFLLEARTENRLALITHPERGDMNISADGLEVFSLHTAADEINKPLALMDAIWGYLPYPQLSIVRHFKRPDRSLKLYDRLSAKERLTLFASTDVHQGVGIRWGGTDSNPWFDLIIDRYDGMFRIVRNHVLLGKDEELTKGSLISAVRSGNCFVGLDVLGDSDGFRFSARSGGKSGIMGEELEFEPGARLESQAPLESRFVIIRNGERYFEQQATSRIELKIEKKGNYRVEVYRDELGSPFDTLPWIISNPIYLR
ncbi:MAG: hypothetical protein HKN33_16540 [Pyrinomonadaceae bacterium]|nr:hypothetical protein [Pyrinomonadaceae bacterium]